MPVALVEALTSAPASGSTTGTHPADLDFKDSQIHRSGPSRNPVR